MRYTKMIMSCLLAFALLIPSAKAFAQEGAVDLPAGIDACDVSGNRGADSAPDIQDKAGKLGQTEPSSVAGIPGTDCSLAQGEGIEAIVAEDAEEEGQGLAIMPFDQTGAPSTSGAALRPATIEQFQMRLTKAHDNTISFIIKTDGVLNPNGGAPLYGKHYEWWIDWGDGTPAAIYTDTSSPDPLVSPNDQSSNGILHSYQGNAGDTYMLTIMPAGSQDAWLGSLGGFFDMGYQGMTIEIVSPLTPLMTRSAAQIANPDSIQPSYEWFHTFKNLSSLTTTGPGFDPAWATATKAGDYFAAYMFYRCYNMTMDPVFNLPTGIITVGDGFATSMFAGCENNSFTMNDVFNLPQGITTVGHSFALSMFEDCPKDAFTMNDVFNLPQGITSVGDNFASNMFLYCQGDAFTMNDVFNMPQGITTVSDYFAYGVFKGCNGLRFTMNDVFNLPQSLTTVGEAFVIWLFGDCYGPAFTMNDVFNMPQGITSVGSNFGSSLFSSCYGDAFTMNDVFNMPQGITDGADYFASCMFAFCGGINFSLNDVFTLPLGMTTVGAGFGYEMFRLCNGLAFTMNDVFNLPQGITMVGDEFIFAMFRECSGPTFTMNDVFNLPQGMVSVGQSFAEKTFFGCASPVFQVNDVFTFPRLAQAELDKNGVLRGTFYALGSANPQKRSAISIINNPNGNPMTAPYYTLYPGSGRYTFESSAFADLPIIHPNWGGLGQTGGCVVSFDANGLTGLAFPGGSAVLCLQGGLVPLPALQLAAGCRLLGWYTDAACTQAWDLASDTVPLGTATMTLYAKGALPLSFVDLGFGVPASTVGTAIAPISTAPGVSGGQPPYAFSASGLPVGLSIDAATGVISGTPTAEAPAGTASITVTDALGQTAMISIAYGEVSKVSGNTGGSGGGGGTGGNGGGGNAGNGGSGAGATGSGPNGGVPAGGSGNGGTTQGKGSPQGGGMAKTGDGLGMLATGAAAMALAALITLLAALIPASLRRQNMIGEGLVKGSAERGLVKG